MAAGCLSRTDMNDPGPTNTSAAGGSWLNRLRLLALSCRICPGVGYRIKQQTDAGTVLEIIPGSPGITATLYRFKSMQGDYLVCRSWDGTNEGTTDVNIAKAYKHRHSIITETLRGVAVTYSAWSLTGQTRNATDGTNPETQYMTPPFNVNDLVWAIPATTLVNITAGSPPVTTAVALLDLNIDGRAWAAF